MREGQGNSDVFPWPGESPRVALVHDWLVGMRGGEKVLESFCRLFPNADVYPLVYIPEKVSATIRNMTVYPSWIDRVPILKDRFRDALPLLMKTAERLPTSHYDLVIATSHCVAKAAPAPKKGLHLSYVFTPMRYAWDGYQTYAKHSGWRGEILRVMRSYLQHWDRRTSTHTDGIAADSHFVAKRIRRVWRRDARVIHPGVELERFTAKEAAGGNYFLIVSALVPYKRVELAARAAIAARQRLVVVGDGPSREALSRYESEFVQLKGWQSDDEVAKLYRGARALLYPQVEDYGITALEAQACGTPVIAFGKGGALETVVAGKTGAFFWEQTVESLAEALRHHDDELFAPTAIRAHAERFSVPRFELQLRQWIRDETRFIL